jgi:hypothetical protein
MTLPTTPFAALPLLFLVSGDSDLLDALREAHGLLVAFPELIRRAEADLDAHGCSKKALRLADAAWRAERTALLLGHADAPAVVDPAKLKLSRGRPRTPAYVVLIALLLRGYFGAGFKSCEAATMMQESITLRIFFANLGMTMPGQSTLTELVNAISNETRQSLLDAQVALVLGLGWDDFSVMLQDSTHVEGNTGNRQTRVRGSHAAALMLLRACSTSSSGGTGLHLRITPKTPAAPRPGDRLQGGARRCAGTDRGPAPHPRSIRITSRCRAPTTSTGTGPWATRGRWPRPGS